MTPDTLGMSGGTTHGLTLALPSDRVRDFLPCGLELGDQNITEPGTHPVVLFFGGSAGYHEHWIGVPFAYISRAWLTPGRPGPYLYVPVWYTDDPINVIGGVLLWSFSRRLARFEVDYNRFSVTSPAGERLTSLAWEAKGGAPHKPPGAWPRFRFIQGVLNQPLISMVAPAIGPFCVLTDMNRNWNAATLRPLETVLEVHVEYVIGFQSRLYSSSGIDESILGSYEMQAPWQLSLPYLPLFGR